MDRSIAKAWGFEHEPAERGVDVMGKKVTLCFELVPDSGRRYTTKLLILSLVEGDFELQRTLQLARKSSPF